MTTTLSTQGTRIDEDSSLLSLTTKIMSVNRANIDVSLLKKVRCRFLDRSTDQPVPGVTATLTALIKSESDVIMQLPVAMLRSDATGYVSFDLKSVDLGKAVVFGFYISAPRFGLSNYDLFGSLVIATKNEIKNKATDEETKNPLAVNDKVMLPNELPAAEKMELPSLVFSIYLDKQLVDEEESHCSATHLPSIQSPDVFDYKASPFSFVTPSSLKLGEGCCEVLLPSSLPVQQYRFNKIVVRHEPDLRNFPGTTFNVDVSQAIVPKAKDLVFGEVLEYEQDWYSLGHSLGEIKYSLPLAPGESTELAVIEWSREDLAGRTDNIRATEFLDHDLRRDRAIEDMVEAALREEQGGNSHMGGTSGIGGGGVPGVWGVTGNHAIGGSISYSYGNRNVEGESLQDLHDRVRQASSYVRSLNSTVIVQASQAEKNAIQTRRVANHNHCHALTIQYYEVLRHYRMTTRFSGRRQVVLIPFSIFSFEIVNKDVPAIPATFNWKLALRFRTVLEQTLLDPTLKDCFESLVRLHFASSVYDLVKIKTQEKKTDPKTKDAFFYLKVSEGEGKKSGITVKTNDVVEVTTNGRLYISRNPGTWPVTATGDPTTDATKSSPKQSFLAPGLVAYSLIYKIGASGPWKQGFEAFNFTADDDGEIIFGVNTLNNDFFDYGKEEDKTDRWNITITYPNHEEDSISPADHSKDEIEGNKVFLKSDDELCEARLFAHLSNNIGYYSSAVWRLMDPVERRLYLETALAGRPTILSSLDDKPIAISGNYVAFPYDGPISPWTTSMQNDVQVPSEDIVTLPTRGLFAEAQMGHCNSCEKRDATRNSDWTEMTVETPPEITGITPGQKGTMPAITQGQLPGNVIQITQPPTAPDPSGLANAFNVLKTPDIFRDMANLDEVSKLLGELAKASGDANTKMMAERAKEKVDDMKKNATNTNAGTATSGVSATDMADRFSLLPEIKSFAKDIGLTPEEYKQFALDQLLGTQQQQPTPPAKTGSTTTSGVDRIVDFFSTFPGTNNPIFGLYDFGIREPISGQETSSSFFIKPGSAIGRIPVKLPAGVWELQGRIQAQIPESTLTVPVTVLPESLIAPFDFIAQQEFATSSIPIDIVGTINAKPSARLIEVEIEALFETVSVNRKVELSAAATTSAQLNSEVKTSVEGEGNVYLADLKARGEFAFGTQYALSGTASAGQELTLTISYKRLTGFKLTQR